MRIIKKGFLCLLVASVFSALWVLLLNVFEPLRGKNYEFITFIVFTAVSIGISLFFTREYFKLKDMGVLKKISFVGLTAILSFAVIVGVFYAAIFGLLYHH